jgi:hypothetical protein
MCRGNLFRPFRPWEIVTHRNCYMFGGQLDSVVSLALLVTKSPRSLGSIKEFTNHLLYSHYLYGDVVSGSGVPWQ